MSLIKIITTSDGSHSLLNEELNETYHSVHGAIQESCHVFIQRGLQFYIEEVRPNNISVLEVGFGTGLNTLLSVSHVIDSPIVIQYTTLELFPLQEEVWSVLNYSQMIGLEEYFSHIHRCSWGTAQKIIPNFELTKRHTALQEVELMPETFDLIYFDAFAPSKQPELWTFAMLQKIERAMKLDAVFVTYCAKGQLKRDLKALGLVVETLQGPPGKNEMVRAVKIDRSLA